MGRYRRRAHSPATRATDVPTRSRPRFCTHARAGERPLPPLTSGHPGRPPAGTQSALERRRARARVPMIESATPPAEGRDPQGMSRVFREVLRRAPGPAVLLLGALLLAPIWAFPLFPSQDGPSHVAN